VVEEEENHKAYAVEERHQIEEPHFMLPQQTYQHLIGRAFGVAFNDRSFISPEVTSSGADRYYYGSLGTRTLAAAPQIHTASVSK